MAYADIGSLMCRQTYLDIAFRPHAGENFVKMHITTCWQKSTYQTGWGLLQLDDDDDNDDDDDDHDNDNNDNKVIDFDFF